MGDHIYVDNDWLKCSVDGQLLWSFPFASIVLVAEYTTNEGPFADDLFLLILSLEEGALIEARIGLSVSGGFGPLFEALDTHLGAKLGFTLAGCTVWNSRVMWPRAVEHERFFSLHPVKPRGMWERLQTLCLGPSLSLALTGPVRAFLRQYEEAR